MHNDKDGNIFDDDDTLDFIIYENLEKRDIESKNRNGGCFGIITLLLLAGVSTVLC
jgi:hypothetical protein